MKNHKILIPISIASLVLILGAVSTLPVSAETASDSQTLMDKIRQRFNLNQDQVDTVIDEYRTERQTEMRNLFNERLSEEVKNGNLTQEQMDKIVAKHEEIQKRNENTRAELEKWASDNGIDMKYFQGFGMKMNRGGGMHAGYRW